MNQNFLSYFLRSVLLFDLVLLTTAKRWPDLHWNSSNPLFDEYDPKAYFMSIAVNEHDIMYFVCPTAENRSESMEFLIVHMVSEMSFLTCQLDSNAIPFLACNDSQQHASNRRRKKVIFRQFSPTPDAMVYSPGTSYYFIATSNGSFAGLWNTQRGLCANKNMRLKIDFEPNNHTNELEYLIEERAEFPVQQTTTNYDSHFAEEIADNHVNLADIFHINPEYLEFVRNHAVRGGTGEIRFPSDGQLMDDPNTGKRPRFVSRNSIRKYNSNNRAQEARIKLETTSREPDSDSVISYSNDIRERNEYISFTGSQVSTHWRSMNTHNRSTPNKPSYLIPILITLVALFLL